MKFYIDNKLVYEITDTQKKILLHVFHKELFDDIFEHKIRFILDRELEVASSDLRNEWMNKLRASGVKSIPLDQYELAELIFSQPGYKNKNDKDPFIKEKNEPPSVTLKEKPCAPPIKFNE